jgi:RHS repeat-associated protein
VDVRTDADRQAVTGQATSAVSSGELPGEFLYFFHPDHLGSTSYVTDDKGAVYEHLQYFPFGETWVQEGQPSQRIPYLFTSKELDEETGLYYFGARYYDARTSLWVSVDPVVPRVLGDVESHPRLTAKLSMYSYVESNPLKLVDPSGADEQDAFRALTVHRESIIASAKESGIPPLLLGDVIYQEQKLLSPAEDLIDSIGASLLNIVSPSTASEVSLGLGQMKIKTAAALLGFDPNNLTSDQVSLIKGKLTDPKSSIQLSAMYLKSLKDQPNRFPEMSVESLGTPETRTERGVIATEYNIGPTGSSREKARPGPYGREATSETREGTVKKLLEIP